MDYNKVKTLLEKYFKGTSSLKEEEMIRNFFTQNTDMPPELAPVKAMFYLFKTEKDIHFQQKRNISRHRLILRISAIAASVVLILGLAFLFQKTGILGDYAQIFGKLVTIRNETSEIKKIVLSDDNIIWMNKNSVITYPKNISSENNKITVIGEVFFELLNNEYNNNYQIIAHNAIIKTENLSSFNVKSLPDRESIDITVNSGTIKVLEKSSTDGLALLVTEGHYCSVHKSQKLVFASVNKNDNYLAWKTGKLIFNQSPMATVKDVLAEYYNIHIELEDEKLAYCEFSGFFEKKSIDFILNQIKTDLNFKITNNGNSILVTGEECLKLKNRR